MCSICVQGLFTNMQPISVERTKRSTAGTEEEIKKIELQKHIQVLEEGNEGALMQVLVQIYLSKEIDREIKQVYATAIFNRIKRKENPPSVLLSLFRIFSLFSETVTDEIIELMCVWLDPEKNEYEIPHLWSSQILTACLHLSLNERTKKMMQTKEFFQNVLKNINICQEKTIKLSIALINKDLYTLIDTEYIDKILENSKDADRVRLVVLQAYVEGYSYLENEAHIEEKIHEKRLSLPWDKKKLEYFPLPSQKMKNIIDELVRGKTYPLAYTALAFLIRASKTVFQYLFESGEMHRITKEGLFASDIQRLRIEHFLIQALESPNRLPGLLIEEGYITEIIRRLEKKISDGVFDGNIYSCFSLLRALSRNKDIVKQHISTYHTMNLMEKTCTVLLSAYKKTKSIEIEKIIIQYLMLMGNLSLYSRKWKEASANCILIHLQKYSSEEVFRISALKAVQMVLYECKEDILEKIQLAVPISFFESRDNTKEEKLERYRIYRNFVCTTRRCIKVEKVISLFKIELEKTTELLIEKRKIRKLTDIEILLAKELLYTLSNIAAAQREYVVSADVVSTAINLSSISVSLTENLIWYLTNLAWSTPLPHETLESLDILNVLIEKKSTDPDLNKRIDFVISLLTVNSSEKETQRGNNSSNQLNN